MRTPAISGARYERPPEWLKYNRVRPYLFDEENVLVVIAPLSYMMSTTFNYNS